MKRLFVFLACLMSLAIFSCSDSKDDNGDDPNGGNSSDITLELSTTDIVFEAEGGEKEFYITCNGDWTITNTSQWCKTDITSGNGNATISVTVNPSELYDDQNTNITVKAGTNTKILTVTQKKKDAILLTKDKYDLPTTGGDITVEVKSNITYTTTIPQKFNWIKRADSKSRALETKNLNFKIEANPNTDKREGFIIFKDNASELADTVHVYQAQKDELILTQDTYNVPTKGETINVELKTNVDYEVIIPEEAKDWIEQLASRASRVDRLSFAISGNITYDDRQAGIIIKDKNSDLADTLHVIQSQVNAIILSQNTYKVPAEGMQITIELKSNIKYEAFISKDVQAWITTAPASRSLNASTLRFNISENNTFLERQGEIIVRNYNWNEGPLADTIRVIQAPKNGIIQGNVLLQLQEDVDKIKGCQQITGNLVIRNKVKNLEALGELTEIGGNLCIASDDLTSLKGLEKLRRIGGNFEISDAKLNSFSELINLSEIGGDFKIGPNLYGNSCRFESFNGLENLETIGGDFELIIADPVFNLIESFEGLNNLVTIGGNFKVNASLSTNQIYSRLNTFKGLDNLSMIMGDFELTSWIQCNCSLKSFEGLENLKNIGGSFHVRDYNTYPIESFKSLENLTTIGSDFLIEGTGAEGYFAQNLTSFEGLNSLASIGGSFSLNSVEGSGAFNALKSFKGLERLEVIGGNLELISHFDNPLAHYVLLNSFNTLESFDGLENLTKIGGNLTLDSYVRDLNGGDNLKSASFNTLKSFKGLEGLTSIGGDLILNSYANLKTGNSLAKIHSESFNAFESFEGLNNVVTIGGKIKISSVSLHTGLNSGYTSPSNNASFMKLNNYCALKKALANHNGEFSVTGVPYSPTKEEILNGECSNNN